MTYVISDIHGCYQTYLALLEKLGFCDDDTLFVLGDAMDRGPEPIKVIRDLMERPNVFYILGNHDLMMLDVMEKLAVDVTEDSLEGLTMDLMERYHHWLGEGGDETAAQFQKLSREERMDILDFLRCAPLYDTVEHDGCLYVLVHAGLGNFDPNRGLEDYAPHELVWERPDYGEAYFPGKPIFVVTGHTPTPMIRPDRQPLIYREKGHIAIDCGCVFEGFLAAFCIETGEVHYESMKDH